MEQQGMQQMNTNYRPLTKEELKRVRKKAIPLITCGIICILFGVFVVVLLYSVFGEDAAEELMSRTFLKLMVMLVFMFILGISICYKDIRLIAASKHMLVAVVQVHNIRVKPGDGYRYRGEVCVVENGQMKQVDAGILKDVVETVRLHGQAKLYFLPGKYYILDEIG